MYITGRRLKSFHIEVSKQMKERRNDVSCQDFWYVLHLFWTKYILNDVNILMMHITKGSAETVIHKDIVFFAVRLDIFKHDHFKSTTQH